MQAGAGIQIGVANVGFMALGLEGLWACGLVGFRALRALMFESSVRGLASLRAIWL